MCVACGGEGIDSQGAECTLCASAPEACRVRIELDRPVHNSKVIIDNHDVSHIVRAVRLEAVIGEVARVTLELIPEHVEVTGFGDVYRQYARLATPHGPAQA